MFDARHIALHRELLKTAEEKIALDPSLLKTLGLLGAGGALTAVPTYLVTHARDEAERQKTKNHAFGAGLATGVATPKIMRGLFNIANRTGFMGPDAMGMTA